MAEGVGIVGKLRVERKMNGEERVNLQRDMGSTLHSHVLIQTR